MSAQDNHSLVLDGIRQAGVWYELPNFEALSLEEFRAEFPAVECPDFNRIQRQCDSIAIEFSAEV